MPSFGRPRFPRREIALALASVLVTIGLIEGSSILFFPRARTALLQEAAVPGGSAGLVDGHFHGLYALDPRLGWAPRAGASGRKWGVPVTILNNGLRSNGGPPVRPAPVLVLGDSYTFGDEAADADTWPAQLERALGVGVLNGGVSGYGLDQMLLRAEDLVPRYRPRVVLVGLIDDDLYRVVLRVRHGIPKPYFRTEGGALELQNFPAPSPRPVPAWRQWAQHLYTANFVMDRLWPRFWWRGTMRDFEEATNDADPVGERLIEAFAGLSRRHGVAVVFVMIECEQGDLITPEVQKMREWVSRAAGPSIRLVDTLATFDAATAVTPGGLAAFSNPRPLSHLNAAGNRLIAEAVRGEVASLLVMPTPAARQGQ